MFRLPLALVAAAFLALPVTPAAAAAASPWVLSVRPGFSSGSLPAGVTVTHRMDRVGVLAIDGAPTALPALLRTPGVRGVYPDVAMHTTGTSPTTGPAVLAPAAVGGAAGTANAGAGVTVAVIDSGVADTSTLNRKSGSLVRGPDYSGDPSERRDGFGHGTFMANLVAGGSVSGYAIGVAPGAVVVDVKVADGTGATTLSNVIRGLNWVADKGVASGVRVVSLSLAAGRPTGGYGSDPLTDAADAVQTAGPTVVVSAGNDPTQVGDPGQDPALLTVGAADTSGSKNVVAPFSGRAVVAGEERPDVVAPGVHVVSQLPGDSLLAQQNPSSAWGPLWRGTGTSEATAVVAGEVAVFLSGRGGVPAQDVRESFAVVATRLGDGSGHGYSVIPTAVAHGTGGQPTATSTTGTSSPTTTSSSWSSSSWSSSSWSSSSWSSSSWSSSSWSSSSWSGKDWN